MLLSGCVAIFFPSTVGDDHSVFDFGVSNTFAHGSRERLLSFGRTYMLLDFCVSDTFAHGSRELLLSFGRTYMLLAMLSFKCARPTRHVGRANTRITSSVLIQQQVVCGEILSRELFRVECYALQKLINPLIRIDP